MPHHDKQLLRAHIKAKLKQVPEAERLHESEFVTSYILSSLQWQNAKIVLLFSSLPDEIDTSLLLSETLKAGKLVLLPVVDGSRLLLREYTNEMHLGCFGIKEPNGPLFTEYKEIDLAIVPGIAFDRDGNRLGRGKGYYDTLLPMIEAYKIGICYSFQLVECVPTESFDVSVDAVVALHT